MNAQPSQTGPIFTEFALPVATVSRLGNSHRNFVLTSSDRE
jgi:hypothetical protein